MIVAVILRVALHRKRTNMLADDSGRNVAGDDSFNLACSGGCFETFEQLRVSKFSLTKRCYRQQMTECR